MSVESTVVVLGVDDTYYVETVYQLSNLSKSQTKDFVNSVVLKAQQAGRVTKDLNEALAMAEKCDEDHLASMGEHSEHGVAQLKYDGAILETLS